MSTDFDHGRANRALRHDRVALILVFAAFAWGVLIILAAITVPIVTTSNPADTSVTATAPPTLRASTTPTLPPSSQHLFESPRVSILNYDGPAGVAVASIPAAVSLLVGALLWAQLHARRRRAFVLIGAWALSVALVVAGVAGFLTFLVGIVFVPSGVLLIIACSQAAPSQRPKSRA